MRNSLRLSYSVYIWLYVLLDRTRLCDKINSHVYLHSMAHERAFQLRCELLLSVNIIYAFSGECKKKDKQCNKRSLLSWDMIIDIRLLLLLVSDNDKWVKKERKYKALIDFMCVCTYIQKKKQACIIIRRYKHVFIYIKKKSLMRYVA